jgi:hypothetical protein
MRTASHEHATQLRTLKEEATKAADEATAAAAAATAAAAAEAEAALREARAEATAAKEAVRDTLSANLAANSPGP